MNSHLIIKKVFKNTVANPDITSFFDNIEHRIGIIISGTNTQPPNTPWKIQLTTHNAARKAWIYGRNNACQFGNPFTSTPRTELINEKEIKNSGYYSTPVEFNLEGKERPLEIFAGKGTTFLLDKYNRTYLTVSGTNWIGEAGIGKFQDGYDDFVINRLIEPAKFGNERIKKIIPSNFGEASFILTEAGNLYACGRNNYGKLGIGNEEAQSNFTKITNVTHVKDVVSLFYNTFIITDDNRIYSCGDKNLLGKTGQSTRNTFAEITTGTPPRLTVCGGVDVDGNQNYFHTLYNDNGLSTTTIGIEGISGLKDVIIFSNFTENKHYICGRNIVYSNDAPTPSTIKSLSKKQFTTPILMKIPTTKRITKWYVNVNRIIVDVGDYRFDIRYVIPEDATVYRYPTTPNDLKNPSNPSDTSNDVRLTPIVSDVNLNRIYSTWAQDFYISVNKVGIHNYPDYHFYGTIAIKELTSTDPKTNNVIRESYLYRTINNGPARLEWGGINTASDDPNYIAYEFDPRLENPLMKNIIGIATTDDVTVMLEYLTTSDEIST